MGKGEKHGFWVSDWSNWMNGGLSPQSSCVEILISTMMVFGDGGLWELISFRFSHEDGGSLMMG